MTHSRTNDENIVHRMEAEHEDLNGLLQRIQGKMSSLPATDGDLTVLFLGLRDALRDHFRHEEEEGLFAQIADHAPRLADRADDLCSEHAQMLREVGSLVEQAKSFRGNEHFRRLLHDAFDRLRERLIRHESDENELLQRTYGEDIAGQD